MSKRKRRPQKEPAPATSTTMSLQNTDFHGDFDFDERVIAQVDWSIWRALKSGQFRLAIKCHHCGRWVHNPESKRAHRDRRCIADETVTQ